MPITSDMQSGTTLAAVIPEVWSSILNRPNYPKAVFMNFFRNLTEFVTEGGDICHVPGIYTSTAPTNDFAESLFGSTAGTADVQSTQGTEVTTGAVTMVDVSLTVNTHVYVNC